MSEARKCDICGCLFEKSQIHNSINYTSSHHGVGSLRVLLTVKAWDGFIDACQSCHEKAYSLLKGSLGGKDDL